MPASSKACLQYAGITTCRPLVVSHMWANGKRHLECTFGDYTPRAWTPGGQKWGFLLCFQLRVTPRKEKRNPNPLPHSGAGLQARCSGLSTGHRLPFTILESLCLCRNVIPNLITRAQRSKCGTEEKNVRINGGKNGGLCAREKITGSSEETFISMRKDREVTKNSTSHISTFFFCIVWLITYMRGLSPMTLYIRGIDTHGEILQAWEECGRGEICG